MPTYEYRCASCGQHIEVVQSFSDDPLTECGACGGPLRKVFAPVGVVFKGSGFYRTDNRSSVRSAPKDSKDSRDSKEPKGKSAEKESRPDGGSSSSGGASSSTKDSKIA